VQKSQGRALIILIIGLIVIGLVVISRRPDFNPWVVAYGLLTLSLLCIKMVASITYRPRKRGDTSLYSVAVIIPVYNEDPRLFRKSLESVIYQTRKVDEIYVVDDHSNTDECYPITLILP
jgi:hyaluronan synthase